MPLRFTIEARADQARAGVLELAHGRIETPAFLPLATQGAIKGLDHHRAHQLGVGMLMCNSFHLELRPGSEEIERHGGAHAWMDWPGCLASDSGGFQVFSLTYGHVSDEVKGRRRISRQQAHATSIRISEEEVRFRSYLDGSPRRLSPEQSMAVQQRIGADIVMALDECSPFNVSADYTSKATERNWRWARRCVDAFEALAMGESQALYGIVHGGIYPDLRRRSAEVISGLPVGGYAIGDCLGRDKQEMGQMVRLTVQCLPPDRPRHLLGIGEVDDLLDAVCAGVDTFDCAAPTRLARHGVALAPGAAQRYRIDLARSAVGRIDGPILTTCHCRACNLYGRSYLHHLIKAHEALAVELLVEHNLCFMQSLTSNLRRAIGEGRVDDFRGQLENA